MFTLISWIVCRIAPNPKHELNHCQFDQDDRVEAWASVIFAIAVFHKLIDEAPIYGVFQLSYQMIFRHKFFQTRELYLIPIPSSVARHHFPRPLDSIIP